MNWSNYFRVSDEIQIWTVDRRTWTGKVKEVTKEFVDILGGDGVSRRHNSNHIVSGRVVERL